MSEMNIVNLGNKKESKMYDKRLIVYGVVENMEADPTALKKLKPLYMYPVSYTHLTLPTT